MTDDKQVNNVDIERIKEKMQERSAKEAPPPTSEMVTPEASEHGLSSGLSWHYVAQDWERLKGRVQESWSRLSDAEFDQVAGNYDAFVSIIEQRYGVDATEAEAQVETWLRDLDST